jgi:hypothetical protein
VRNFIENEREKRKNIKEEKEKFIKSSKSEENKFMNVLSWFSGVKH